MKLFILFWICSITSKKSSFCYCYCEHLENGGKRKMCSIPIIFNDFKKDVERNLFNVNFLFNYYIKLCHERFELFNHKKDCIECFQGEYKFGGRDWYICDYWSVTLSLWKYSVQWTVSSCSSQKRKTPDSCWISGSREGII